MLYIKDRAKSEMVQHKGEIIMSFPGTFHQAMNKGICLEKDVLILAQAMLTFQR